MLQKKEPQQFLASHHPTAEPEAQTEEVTQMKSQGVLEVSKQWWHIEVTVLVSTCDTK